MYKNKKIELRIEDGKWRVENGEWKMEN